MGPFLAQPNQQIKITGADEPNKHVFPTPATRAFFHCDGVCAASRLMEAGLAICAVHADNISLIH
jgi:hypothetical protein